MAPDAQPAGRLLVLIPAYNEEERLAEVIAGVRRIRPDAEILVVDDCSRDRTGAVARRAGARVVRHPINLGYGAGLLTGYRYADRCGFDRVVQLDGDGQHDASGIPALLEALDGPADLVIGSRFLKGSGRYRPSWMRAVGMWIFARVASATLGRPITDPTSGFQALSGRLIRFHARGNHFPQDYPDADMLILVGRNGFTIREIPVTMFEKPGGASIHSGLRPLYYVVKMTLSILLILSGARRTAGKEAT
ncbi:MAG: glycosyltransferase [Candidatus Eisenbacteria bacterium]|nr:glycosyltransferase [Candidatus Latescibacterota bacterium]MBD3301083.1 glycosyltransferase [Candidatus Eisenbacteria bacterium]